MNSTTEVCIQDSYKTNHRKSVMECFKNHRDAQPDINNRGDSTLRCFLCSINEDDKNSRSQVMVNFQHLSTLKEDCLEENSE